MRKKRILLVINRFGRGGAERLSVDLLNNFDRSQYEVFAAAVLSDGDKNYLEGQIDASIEVFKPDFRNLYDIRTYVRFGKMIRQCQPEVVISNLYFSNFIVRVLKIFFGYKVICVEHSNYEDRKKIHILLNKLLNVVTDKYVAISQGVADFFAKQTKVNPQKIAVIENGIDFNKALRDAGALSKGEVFSELGIAPGSKLFVSVGRLVPEKNYLALVTAFCRFQTDHQNCYLVIIGEGPEKSALLAEIDQFQCTNVMLLGAKSNIHPYLASSDFFVSSSRIEGFGLVILEAMAHTVPIITTPSIGGKLLVRSGANGVISEGFSYEAIEQALRDSVEMNLQISSTEVGRLKQQYDIKVVVGKYQELISQL